MNQIDEIINEAQDEYDKERTGKERYKKYQYYRFLVTASLAVVLFTISIIFDKNKVLDKTTECGNIQVIRIIKHEEPKKRDLDSITYLRINGRQFNAYAFKPYYNKIRDSLNKYYNENICISGESDNELYNSIINIEMGNRVLIDSVNIKEDERVVNSNKNKELFILVLISVITAVAAKKILNEIHSKRIN